MLPNAALPEAPLPSYTAGTSGFSSILCEREVAHTCFMQGMKHYCTLNPILKSLHLQANA